MNDFIYLADARSDYSKAAEFDLWFKRELTQSDKDNISALIPHPLNLNLEFGERSLHMASDDVFSYRILGVYGNFWRRLFTLPQGYRARANMTELSCFYDDLDLALNKIHQICPVFFFLQPPDENSIPMEERGKHETYISNEIVPDLTAFLAKKDALDKDKKTVAWMINNLFSYIPRNIDQNFASNLIKLIELSKGFDSYIDDYNEEILQKLRQMV